MSSENLPYPSGTTGSGDSGLERNRSPSAPADGYDELTAIRADPAMLRLARHLQGSDLAEDLLQQAWYAVAQALARGRPIGNLPAYFYQVMVNGAGRMREDIARQGIPADDPVAVAGPRRGRELAAASAEDDALLHLLSAARRELLRRRGAELRQDVPASSPDPDRYRDAIMAIAERMLSDDGPASRAELNAALVAAYPEWFAAPDAAVATKYQRRCRGREDLGRVLEAVIRP